MRHDRRLWRAGLVATVFGLTLASTAWTQTPKPKTDAATGAVAAGDPKQIGDSFLDKGGKHSNSDVLFFVTMMQDTQKLAVLFEDVHWLYPTPTSPVPSSHRLLLGFYDKDDWHQFAALWDKARRAQPPGSTEKDLNVGSYFDSAADTLLTVSVVKGGNIGLSLAGEPSRNVPQVISLFELVPDYFKDFDESVTNITVYFSTK
jgi:hypothetical protein